MSDALIRIKRSVLAGQYAFSEKARIEMESEDLTELDVAESILNAVAVYKEAPVNEPISNGQGVPLRDPESQPGRPRDILESKAS
ncbi:MAG: hypothetical protein LAQ69_40755 [Acidobacteriia bacterium]|nr:hypothetical protein [Terriglobia bacterium]